MEFEVNQPVGDGIDGEKVIDGNKLVTCPNKPETVDAVVMVDVEIIVVPVEVCGRAAEVNHFRVGSIGCGGGGLVASSNILSATMKATLLTLFNSNAATLDAVSTLLTAFNRLEGGLSGGMSGEFSLNRLARERGGR